MVDSAFQLIGLQLLGGSAIADHQVVTTAQRFRQAFQASGGLGIEGILGQRPSQSLIGPCRIVETILAGGGNLVQKVDLAPHVQRVARLDLQSPHQVGKVATRPVHRIQDLSQNQVVVGMVEKSLQRCHGFLVARRQVEQSSIGLHRGGNVVQLLFAQLSETREQAHLLVFLACQLELSLQVVR